MLFNKVAILVKKAALEFDKPELLLLSKIRVFNRSGKLYHQIIAALIKICKSVIIIPPASGSIISAQLPFYTLSTLSVLLWVVGSYYIIT